MQAQIVETELVTRRRWHGSIREAWGGQCAYCGATAQSLDHVIPRSQGGPTVRENCVPACLACNGSKGSQEVLQWWRPRIGWTAFREQRLLEWVAGNNSGGLHVVQDPERTLALEGGQFTYRRNLVRP